MPLGNSCKINKSEEEQVAASRNDKRVSAVWGNVLEFRNCNNTVTKTGLFLPAGEF
jgi:formylmethanofuran dehydrogenase subunit D